MTTPIANSPHAAGIPELPDPFELFAQWLTLAKADELNDPTAMALATIDADGKPSVRMVLLKDFDHRGFVFYTNLTSRKGAALAANRQAALCFHWKSLRRQVRIEGSVEAVSDDEADRYFTTRPYQSQIGAWASLQSQVLDRRATLEDRVADFSATYPQGSVPRPPHWSGFRVVPDRIEFWQDQPFRLHDRRVYTPGASGWSVERLYP